MCSHERLLAAGERGWGMLARAQSLACASTELRLSPCLSFLGLVFLTLQYVLNPPFQ